MSEIQEKQKYVFNHETENIHESIGITEPRFDEMIAAAKSAYKECEDMGHVMEAALNKICPIDKIEAFALGYAVGVTHGRASVMDNPIVALLSQMDDGK